MQAYAVVGAGFGDEGKGASVDALVHQLLRAGRNPIVVRSGSGAQAAHTVQFQSKSGTIRHVFGHIGSGTLSGENGAPTWLGPSFVHNPPLFLKEYEQLRALGVEPDVLADPNGLVTLPIDVAINQGLERSRGGGRHGSCGIGFGETIGRSETPHWRVTFSNVQSGLDAPDRLAERVTRISQERAHERLRSIALTEDQRDLVVMATKRSFVEAWMEDALAFARTVKPCGPESIRSTYDAIVFEGAQGLLLDRDAAFFPHVTRSRTGLPNVVELLDPLGIERLEVVYVTRSYATRHGAGPLPGEGLSGSDGKVLKFDDATNVLNPFQEALRFAPVATSLVGGAILLDLATARAQTGIPITPRLALTCLDQTDGKALVLGDGRVVAVDPTVLAQRLGVAKGWLPTWMTYGADRSDRDAELDQRQAA